MGVRHVVVALCLLATACGGGKPPAQTQADAGQAGPSSTPSPARPAPGAVVTEEFLIDAKDDGIKLYIRNKHTADYSGAKPERTVLFLHGASFAGSATFDLALDGTSWMDWLAKRGYDVYSLDIRGYGKSTRPPQMEAEADANAPLVTSDQALRDVSKAVDFITSRRSLDRLVLVGWSWGATLAGSYTASGGIKVERLVLYSPPWLREDAAANTETPKLGAWRTIALSAVKDRWLKAVPDAAQAETVPHAWADAVMESLKATDPDHGKMFKVPTGAMADHFATWAVGKPAWNPSRISVPTLIIQGEWDIETPPHMGLGVFSGLTKAPAKRYIMVGRATHMLAFERNRLHLYRAVQGFLEEKF